MSRASISSKRFRQGKIQAIVYDEPFLRYVIRTQYPGQFTVIPLNVDPQLYAFALREGNPLRESINRVLLRKIHEPAWHDLLLSLPGQCAERTVSRRQRGGVGGIVTACLFKTLRALIS